MAASSWAAKILKGLFQKSKTDMNSLSQILCNLLNANSLSSASEILYLDTKFQHQFQNGDTVKLGHKERFDKEQIGVKEQL